MFWKSASIRDLMQVKQILKLAGSSPMPTALPSDCADSGSIFLYVSFSEKTRLPVVVRSFGIQRVDRTIEGCVIRLGTFGQMRFLFCRGRTIYAFPAGRYCQRLLRDT